MDKLIIRIHKDKRSNAYPVTTYLGTEDSEGLSNAASFRNPLKTRELDTLQKYAEERRSQSEENRTVAVTVNKQFADWGKALFNALFNDDLREIYEEYCNEHNAPPPMHLWLEAPELWALPWELLRDSDRNLNLALTTSITRTMKRPIAETQELGEDLPLKVLYIVARPDDSGFLGLKEPRAVLSALRNPNNRTLRNSVQIELLRPPTYSQFLDQLKRGYHIVHFDGHGYWDTSTKQGGLCFEAPLNQQGERNTHTIIAETLQNALKNNGVKLLVLSACKSGQPHQFNAYASVAHATLNAGVPAVLAMRYSVYADTARVFILNFYRALMENRPIEEAVLHARKHVEAMPEHPVHDWFIPVLYQRTFSTRLFSDAPTQAKPRKIPCTVPELDVKFVGREREQLAIDRALMLDKVSTVTLTGMAGVGKTTLALALVDWYKAGNAFPGGYFWHNFEVGGTVDTVVDEIGTALMGNEWAQIAPNERFQIVQRYFDENPSLLVWDNFETVIQNADAKDKKNLRDFLKKLPERSRALVTCRRKRIGLIPLTKEETVNLNVLNAQDATDLTWLHAERQNVTDKLRFEREKLPEFLEAVGYHPLGISLAVPQLASRGWTLTELISNLRKSVETLALDDELYDDPEVPERLKKVEASFQLTYDALSDDARAILPKLAVTFPGGMWDFTVPFILDIDETAWDKVIGELNKHNLLTRYFVVVEHLGALTPICHLHPLLLTYAAAKLENSDAWHQSVAEKYTVITIQIYMQFQHSNAPRALVFFDVEEANLLYWLAYCENGNYWDWGADLIVCLHHYYMIRGRWTDRERILQYGIAFAERQQRNGITDEIRRKGLENMAMFTQNLGVLYQDWSRLDDAEKCHQKSLEFARQLGNKKGETTNLHGLSNVALHRGDYSSAMEYCKDALAIYDELDDEEGKADIIGQLGNILANQGDDARERGDKDIAQHYDAEAERLYNEALKIYRRVGNQENQAIALSNLGGVARIIGDITSAEQYLQEGLRLSKTLGHQYSIAANYGQLASLYRDLERYQDALSYYIRAEAVFRELGAERERRGNLQNAAVLVRRVGLERFRELCQAAAAESAVGPAEVEAFVEELTAFLKQFNEKLTRAISYIEKKEYTDAISTLQNLLSQARKQKRHEFFAEGLFWLARAYHLRGEHRVAKFYYKDAIAHLQKHNRQGLVAEAQAYLGQLELQIGLVDDARTHLKMARSYFEAAGRQDYVEWIDKLYDASGPMDKRQKVWEKLQSPFDMRQIFREGGD